MSAPKPIQKLLNSEMSRREFLGFLGAASLGVIGATSVIRGLNGLAGRHVDNGYGSSAYGGDKDSSSRKA